MPKNYCGFGMGAIQVGLFLWEAHRSRRFDRLSVVEVDQGLVQRVRANGGRLSFNIASKMGIKAVEIPDVEILHPQNDFDLVKQRLSQSSEIGTAIPSVDFYGRGGVFSIASLLGATQSPTQYRVVYCAENNNHASEVLGAEVRKAAMANSPATTQYLNTVIGKMSGIITDEASIAKMGLHPLVPGLSKAILVEAFNAILVDKIKFPRFTRGIEVFREEPDLHPFKEAKLFAHNCMHAWLAYFGIAKGYQTMDQLGKDAPLMEKALRAFTVECGGGLIGKYGHIGGMFTKTGFEEYAKDLLDRMVNPYLSDTLDRVGRDPARKLGPEDRLAGSALLALSAGIVPNLLLEGIRHGIEYYQIQKDGTKLVNGEHADALTEIWGREPKTTDEKKLFALL